jgi:hypothetical protein
MKFYIASKSQEIAREWKHTLAMFNHKVVARWIDEDGFGSGPPYDDVERAKNAQHDEQDIRQCDALILRAEPDLKRVAGGKHVETGMALILKKQVYVIGQRENIFHWHPLVEVFPSFEEFISEKFIARPSNWG